jgi:hypothetical protein
MHAISIILCTSTLRYSCRQIACGQKNVSFEFWPIKNVWAGSDPKKVVSNINSLDTQKKNLWAVPLNMIYNNPLSGTNSKLTLPKVHFLTSSAWTIRF